ncbi:MAG: FeoC-like transcriptional regulator [Thermotogota bacterium]
MFKEIIQVISKSPYLSKKDIAKQLKIEENLIDQILMDLIRMGYLKKEVCDSSCNACPVSNFCAKTDTEIEYWEITEKGYQLIQTS